MKTNRDKEMQKQASGFLWMLFLVVALPLAIGALFGFAWGCLTFAAALLILSAHFGIMSHKP